MNEASALLPATAAFVKLTRTEVFGIAALAFDAVPSVQF
jgi:hypothetical protein